MDGCARAKTRMRARVAVKRDQLSGSDREGIKYAGVMTSSFTLISAMSTMSTITQYRYSCFGLGKNAPFALKFGLCLCIVKEEDLMWQKSGEQQAMELKVAVPKKP